MQTNFIRQDGVLVIELRGRLDSKTSPQVEQQFQTLIDSGDLALLVDCKELSYISSAGLRVFLMAEKNLKAKGGKIAFAALNESVKLVFRMAGLPPLMAMYATREEALKQLQQS